MSEKEEISVIIPVYNEENIIEKLLINLCRFDIHEIIIVDGGSTDDTVKLSLNFPGVKVISSKKGRAAQMNAGAIEASGTILLFLHADSFVEPNAFKELSNALTLPHVLGGCFYLKFDQDNFWLRIYSRFSRINHSLFTYGDQGLFILKSNFHALGGYKDMQLLEDLEIQRRIRKSGRFIKLPMPITTSARKFRKNGIIYQQVKNIVIVALYLTGVPVSILAKFY